METRTGVCTNTGLCPNADNKRQFVIPRDREFLCPSCQKKLKEVSDRGALPAAAKIVLALLVATGVGLGSYFLYKKIYPPEPTTNTTPVGTATPSPAAENVVKEGECKGMGIHKNVLAEIRKRHYLIMGVQASAMPMNNSPMTDIWEKDNDDREEGKRREKELSWDRTGFDYELARMIVANMGVIGKGNVKAREVPEFKDLFCLLNRQESDGSFSVDIIMSGIARDPLYDNTISWTKPYAEFGYSLVTKKSSYIETLDDCKGKKIGIVAGDNIVKGYVTSQMPDSEIVELSDEKDEWLSDALNLDQVDAVVYDYPFAVEELKWINEEVRESGAQGKLLEIRIANIPNFQLKYSIGVPKGEEDLLEKLNDAIDKVTSEDNPRYASLIQKYFTSTDIKPVEIKPGAKVYIVQRGDSLARIARRELGDEQRWKELGSLNNIGNDHLIVPKQKLILPN